MTDWPDPFDAEGWERLKREMKRKLAWLDRGEPVPLAIDGRAYHLRSLARRRRR